ncbi:MAG: branched-chain amino acid aminotransferase [bacterium]|jgi:branched-chain amino acid aminotransferase
MEKSAKQNLDWGLLGFQYHKTDVRFVARFRDGQWSHGELIESEEIRIHEGAPAIHYAQQCFEGLKAQTAKDGSILLFRPDLNADRLISTADRLLMESVPKELFLRGVNEVVKANYSWVPPYGSGASLYIRPLLIGIGENLGLNPAPEYEFRIFVSPVGPYYKGDGLSLISLAVTDIDRAAPQGTGYYKAGANYAGGLLATKKAKELGANEALYLDAKEREYLEEAGSANIIIATKDNALITPKSDAILPSVTRRSIMTIAKEELGMTVESRPIHLMNEIDTFEEMGACGTAAVLSPVGKILVNNQWHKFYEDGEAVGPVMQKLYDLLTQMQKGEREDPYGWTVKVC